MDKNYKEDKIKLSVIITAGGSSSRYGKTNKLLEQISGKEVILHSIDAFLDINPFEIIVSASEELEPLILDMTAHIQNLKVVRGGATRQASVFNALKACSEPDIVAIHDAARPLIKKTNIEKCIEKTLETGAAIVAVKAVDTIKKVDEHNKIVETPNRDFLWCVQTPQIFDYKMILSIHQKLEGQNFSDDSGMAEYLGHDVYVVEGDYTNIKITTKKDIYLAQMLMNEEV